MEELYILNSEFIAIYMIDEFESLIWTERYASAGNFEYYTPVNDKILEIVGFIQNEMINSRDTYVWSKESSDTLMIIESLQITTSVETGNHLIMSGRSFESVIDRRIIVGQINLDGYLEGQIEKLLNQNIINPSIAQRRIPGFTFKKSGDKRIEAMTIRAQYTGDNLYDTIIGICQTYSLGFKIEVPSVNSPGTNNYVFSFYMGQDRSYAQTSNPYVIFSSKFENIINSEYIEAVNTKRSTALVAGEGEGNQRKTIWVYAKSGSSNPDNSGIGRRELYVDARDIQKETSEVTLTDAEYTQALEQRGREKMAENQYTKAFTGEVEPIRSFVFGQDYFMGDIVQIRNEFKMDTQARVSEIIRAYDTTGLSTYPTFEIVQ